MTEQPYKLVNYFAIALDPIHIGTGGYRLGRVDNTIIREPGTNLPKIPGTSISGVTRAYTAMHPDVKKYPSCAGKGGKTGEEHCGKNDCPVCISYGFSNPKESFQGLAQFSDARILLFPVHSMIGPVWVTCISILKEHGIEVNDLKNNKVKIVNGLSNSNNRINLGWLMLDIEENFSLENEKRLEKVPNNIKNRSVLVSDKLFSQIVNDNLEVRTSVAIDPVRGAVEEGALFTFEAIPRSAIMWSSIIYNNPKNFQINKKSLIQDISWIKNNVEKGLSYLEFMGIGGMGTRGMGRMRILNLSEGG